jgi:hypothetical protein
MGVQSCEMAGMLGRCDMGPSAPSPSLVSCPRTAGPPLSAASRAASNARAMRGWVLVLRRLSHSGSAWGPLRGPLGRIPPGKDDEASLGPETGGRWCHARRPLMGPLATIFSSGCRGTTGCFPRSSQCTVVGGEARCRSWQLRRDHLEGRDGRQRRQDFPFISGGERLDSPSLPRHRRW